MTMPPRGQVAPIPRRVLAYVIDAAIAFGIGLVVPLVVLMVLMRSAGVLVALLIGGSLFGLLGLGWFVAYTIMQAGRGSIGMRAQGLRLADAETGAPLGFGRALLRNIIWGLAGAIVVGCFSPLFDGTGRYQGWHDKVGSALMLDARAGGPVVPAQQTAAFSAPIGFPVPADTAFTPPAAYSSAPTVVPGAPAGVPPMPPPTDAPAPAPADELEEQTVLAPRAGREIPTDSLISFVPGVTQDGAPRDPAPQPAPAAPAPYAAPAEPAPAAPAPYAAPAQPAPAAPPPYSAPAEPAPPTTAGPVHADPAPAAAPADPAPAPVDDDDIESTRISIPGHRLIFTWDDGLRVPVSGRTVFGRNPEQEPGAAVVAVRDETLSLSKTHFEAGASTSGGWVLDRDSTNGTVVVRDGLRIACPPGQRVPIRLGDALEIGDRIVTIGGYA